MTQVEIFAGELAEHRAGAHIGLAEPRALLAAEAEHPDRPGWLRAGSPEVDEAQQAGDDAGESVEVAALRDGVQMRADIDRGARCFVGKTNNEVLCRIAGGRQSFALRKPLDEVERGAFGRNVAFARDAFTIARARRQIVKKLRCQRATRCAIHGQSRRSSSTVTALTTDVSSGVGASGALSNGMLGWDRRDSSTTRRSRRAVDREPDHPGLRAACQMRRDGVPKSCPIQAYSGRFRHTPAHDDTTGSPLRGKALRALP